MYTILVSNYWRLLENVYLNLLLNSERKKESKNTNLIIEDWTAEYRPTTMIRISVYMNLNELSFADNQTISSIQTAYILGINIIIQETNSIASVFMEP
jgi:hypothetical protein